MTQSRTVSPRAAAFLTIVTTFFWGSNFPAAKAALASLPPWTASGERFAIASIGMLIALAWTEGLRWRCLGQNWIAFAILGTIGVAGMNGALYVGLQTTGPVTASLIMATTPLSTNLLEALLQRRAPTRSRIFGCVISFLGVAMVMTKGALFTGGALKLAPGDPIIFLGSLGWASYSVGSRAFVIDSSPIETTAWTMLSGTIVLVCAAFFFERPWNAILQSTGLSQALVLYMAIPGSILAYLFWTVGVVVRGAGPTSILFNFVPIFAVLTAMVVGALPSSIQLIGMAITIFGVLVGNDALSNAIARFRKPAIEPAN